MQFTDFSLSEYLLRAVREEGFRNPTALQRSAIPAILEGRDILAHASTGAGKTASYALPILERLGATSGDTPRALVLAATRDVVMQIKDNFEALGRHVPVRMLAAVESESTAAQESVLREGCDLVIATPGRLLDLVDLGLIRLHDVKLLVLDEVEDLDKLGLLPLAARVASLFQPRPQTLLYSAELSDHVRELAAEVLVNPLELETAPRTLTVSHVDQRVIFTPRGAKGALLRHLLNDPTYDRVVVYLRSRRAAQKLQRQLKVGGIEAELGRPARVQIVTDGAARRVKLNGLTHVINYDVPAEVEVYVHRVGRSVRAGSTAVALTFCDPEEQTTLVEIEKTLQASLTVVENPLPPEALTAAELAGPPAPRPPQEARREPRPAPEPRAAAAPQAAPAPRPAREPRREEPRDDRRGGRPERESRGRFYEDETPPAATITFVSAPHPQVKKTMEEWFAEREERSPLEDAGVAAYLLEHPELAPKKPAPAPRKNGNDHRRGGGNEPRGRSDSAERAADSGHKRRRVRGGQRRGGRRGSSSGAPNPSAGS